MDRPRLLMFSAMGFLLFGVCYWIWSGWGLITVHADGKPLAEVIRSIEKQGGITLKTNMDSAKPVTLHVDKVPLTDALESLSAVTDSRWRLAYVFGADQGTIENRLTLLASGERRPEGWKSFDVPTMGGDGEEVIPPDPRRDTWTVKEPEEKTLQGYLRAAATSVSASFWCPEEFNPAVSSAPDSGQIRKRAPQLAKAAGAKVEELFLLLGRPAGMAENEDSQDGDPTARPQRRERDFSMMRDRRMAEIAKLPPGQREAAQKEFEEISGFMSSLRDLPEGERRAKVEEFFQNSDRMERMEERRMQREERQTPEQRRKRYQRYVERKRSAQS